MASKTGQMARMLEAAEQDECQSLDYRINKARKRMGEARWAECQRNWDNPNFDGGKLENSQ